MLVSYSRGCYSCLLAVKLNYATHNTDKNFERTKVKFGYRNKLDETTQGVVEGVASYNEAIKIFVWKVSKHRFPKTALRAVILWWSVWRNVFLSS